VSVGQYLTQPVLVQPMAPAAPDIYNNTPLAAHGDPVREFGYLDQKDTVAYLDDRQMVVSTFKALLRADSVVTALATLSFDGRKFLVDGEPYRAYNPRTRVVSHIECALKVVS
jgi:hypothetical protein